MAEGGSSLMVSEPRLEEGSTAGPIPSLPPPGAPPQPPASGTPNDSTSNAIAATMAAIRAFQLADVATCLNDGMDSSLPVTEPKSGLDFRAVRCAFYQQDGGHPLAKENQPLRPAEDLQTQQLLRLPARIVALPGA